MEEKNIKSKVISGLFWKFAERSGSQIIRFVVSVILARLLTPEDYGLIGLITVFVTIASVFADSGLGSALVQRKEADDEEFSTVFYFSMVFSFILYGILFVSAPFIARFYNEPQLVSVVRVLALSVIIGGFNSVQQAYVQKTMQFRRLFLSTLVGTLISAFIGIGMAYRSFGVWSLVGQQLSMQAVSVIVLWFTINWRPKLLFSFQKAKRLFSYGWKLLCSSLLDTTYTNVYSLVIGKVYTTTELGYYNQGKQFPFLIVANISGTVGSILFPVLSEAQDNRDKMKAMLRRAMVTSTFLVFPAMAGLAAIAKPLTIILLTEKWLPAVPFIQFCCFTYAFWPVHTANLQAINAVGRSDIFLKLEIIKKVMGVVILVAAIPFGIYTMMIGSCISTIVSTFINAYPNKRLLGYSYVEQMKDMLPAFVLSLIMCLIVLSIQLLNLNIWLTIVIQIILGVSVYFGLAKMFKFECLEYVLNTVKVFRKVR